MLSAVPDLYGASWTHSDGAGAGSKEEQAVWAALQGLWSSEGLLPAPQHVPPEACAEAAALQTHPRKWVIWLPQHKVVPVVMCYFTISYVFKW